MLIFNRISSSLSPLNHRDAGKRDHKMRNPIKRRILCFNSGSSSVKFALYELDDTEAMLVRGAVERIGLEGGWLWLKDDQGIRSVDRHSGFPDHNTAVKALVEVMDDQKFPSPDGVGHRVVHGGTEHAAPELVTPDLVHDLRRMIPLAPLHLPGEIRAIEAVRTHYGGLKQVACFDTAFHWTMPERAKRLPLPGSFWHEGVRRYGFHGLSYEYIVGVLGEDRQGRVIIAHLGNGASMAAVKGGRPLDTTMGFSPMGGLMMGTRSGDLDPGILVYLMDEKGYNARQLEKLLEHHAGLVGVSGISSDMKTLLDQRSTDSQAALAIEMFCYHARKAVGALAAVLGGLDTLVFTGGIGERAAPVRQGICSGLEYLGIHLDTAKNDDHGPLISTVESPCAVRVIATNEDLMIARHTRAVLFAQDKG
jgi:acetate kinase